MSKNPVTNGVNKNSAPKKNVSLLITKALELNNEIFVLINKMLNSSFNIMDSNKIVYRTIFSSTLKLFAKQSRKIVTGQDLDPDLIDHGCAKNFMSNSNAWAQTCYNDLLVDPTLVVDLVKNIMLTQLNYISNDFNSIVVNHMGKNDQHLSELSREILKYMQEKEGNNRTNKKSMNKYLESMMTQNTNKERVDRYSLFSILTVLNEISEKSRKLTKYYELIRKNNPGTVVIGDTRKKLIKTFNYNLKSYQDSYTKLNSLFNNNVSNSSNGVAALIANSSQKLSTDSLSKIKLALEYNSGLRAKPIKIEDQQEKADVMYSIIIGSNAKSMSGNKNSMSNVSGADVKNLLIYFYVFYCSITAKSLQLYTRALKPANVVLAITGNTGGTSGTNTASTSSTTD